MSFKSPITHCAHVRISDAHPTPLLDLLQVLSIIAMERPVSFSAEDIRDEKASAEQASQLPRAFSYTSATTG